MNKINVLSVDDDFINLKLVSSILKKNSYVNRIVEATNGMEALEKLKENRGINLVLLDMIMPIMDGSKFLDNIFAVDEWKEIPVIILTTDETKKQEAYEKGAYDFILKPVREHVLNEKIDKVVKTFLN